MIATHLVSQRCYHVSSPRMAKLGMLAGSGLAAALAVALRGPAASLQVRQSRQRAMC